MADMTDRAIDQAIKLISEAGRVLKGMEVDGHSTTDILEMIRRRLTSDVRTLESCVDATDYFNGINSDELAMGATERAMRRSLAESAQPGQTPAIACFIVLRGLPSALNGSLSQTPEGGLRLLSPTGENPRGGVVPMIEQFFDYQDVVCFGIARPVPVEGTDQPSIILRTS